MGILQNLRNLGEDKLEQNLKAFNIKSTGNVDEDIVNLKNVYFKDIERLYDHLPLGTYEFLETFSREDSEKKFEHDFEDFWHIFENLGLADTSISEIFEENICFLNDYIAENNIKFPLTEEANEELSEVSRKNGFIQDTSFNKKYFEAIDKDIANTLLDFLKNNVEFKENENLILNLISGMAKVYGYLTVDEVFRILNELKVPFSLDRLTIIVNSKVPNTAEMDDIIFIVDKNSFAYFYSEDFRIDNKEKEIYSLETYLQA
ncbi:hypothetical protein H5J22_01405 [Cetobacterium sp. 8H]|uniref:hypothetical protein n=1 Tax=Cetobacterium sp. 8H TaxID=2759681 RepID=UPI00163C0353|nr:hypothetical protein [Cetobacterium sp. 8H]MBC2850119.1 hypothetical protein [Cetobacterium sp. 8H]